mmetsp:Transcript_68760/g.223920  ORF Transcript_68760/g.223920 Transcript_68760/m.223920 type:complete len:261 (-) Transcript_68760:686-1468(-)
MSVCVRRLLGDAPPREALAPGEVLWVFDCSGLEKEALQIRQWQQRLDFEFSPSARSIQRKCVRLQDAHQAIAPHAEGGHRVRLAQAQQLLQPPDQHSQRRDVQRRRRQPRPSSTGHLECREHLVRPIVKTELVRRASPVLQHLDHVLQRLDVRQARQGRLCQTPREHLALHVLGAAEAAHDTLRRGQESPGVRALPKRGPHRRAGVCQTLDAGDYAMAPKRFVECDRGQALLFPARSEGCEQRTQQRQDATPRASIWLFG